MDPAPTEVALQAVHIGGIELRPALALAPMEGVTDLPFRRLIRQIGGCGLTVTEFIPGRNLSERHRRALLMAELDPDEHPVAIQVFGRVPEVMAAAARQAVELGADIVDLNMGCPSKRVCNRSGGSALMREPDVARSIVRAMRRAVEVPFTVKMRAGWDPEHRNAPDIARMCEDEGADAVTVHWRTRVDGYGGSRELDTIAAVVQAVSVPVFANGDIVDAESARSTVDYTQCQGLMIGRGAIRDPWVFQRIERALRGAPPLVISSERRRAELVRYLAEIRDRFDSERGALGRVKKVARYFTEDLEDGATLRQHIWHSQSLAEANDRIEAYFARVAAASSQPAAAGAGG